MRLAVHQRCDVNRLTRVIPTGAIRTKLSIIDYSSSCPLRILTSQAGEVVRRLKTGLLLLLLVTLFIGLSTPFASASYTESQLASAMSTPQAEPREVTTEPKEHGLSAKAVEIARPFNFPITNSMVVTWIVALSLIVFAQVATRNMKRVPSGAQNFLEWLVESLHKFIAGIIGPHLADRTFWFFATIFIFVLSANWVGLIPGVGSIGWGRTTSHGFRIDQPLFRGVNADVNMTLGMALIFFACKGESEGVLKLLMVVVFFVAGCLEIVSILFRPVSLSFRLYGNIFAGENLLEAMAKLVPGFGWLVPVPFYFLELVMGLVQALVFMLLTAVFTMLICQHETEGSVAAHD